MRISTHMDNSIVSTAIWWNLALSIATKIWCDIRSRHLLVPFFIYFSFKFAKCMHVYGVSEAQESVTSSGMCDFAEIQNVKLLIWRSCFELLGFFSSNSDCYHHLRIWYASTSHFYHSRHTFSSSEFYSIAVIKDGNRSGYELCRWVQIKRSFKKRNHAPNWRGEHGSCVFSIVWRVKIYEKQVQTICLILSDWEQ